jgi:hypothetical protein
MKKNYKFRTFIEEVIKENNINDTNFYLIMPGKKIKI